MDANETTGRCPADKISDFGNPEARAAAVGAAPTYYELYQLLTDWNKRWLSLDYLIYYSDQYSSSWGRELAYALERIAELERVVGPQVGDRARMKSRAELAEEVGEYFWEAYRRKAELLRREDAIPVRPKNWKSFVREWKRHPEGRALNPLWPAYEELRRLKQVGKESPND